VHCRQILGISSSTINLETMMIDLGLIENNPPFVTRTKNLLKQLEFWSIKFPKHHLAYELWLMGYVQTSSNTSIPPEEVLEQIDLTSILPDNFFRPNCQIYLVFLVQWTLTTCMTCKKLQRCIDRESLGETELRKNIRTAKGNNPMLWYWRTQHTGTCIYTKYGPSTQYNRGYSAWVCPRKLTLTDVKFQRKKYIHDFNVSVILTWLSEYAKNYVMLYYFIHNQ